MKPIELDLPPEARVIGELYRCKDPQFLKESILHVILKRSIFVDVSWHPEHDPGGAYFVRVYREYWENLLYEDEFDDPSEVADFIQECCREYGASRSVFSPSCNDVRTIPDLVDCGA